MPWSGRGTWDGCSYFWWVKTQSPLSFLLVPLLASLAVLGAMLMLPLTALTHPHRGGAAASGPPSFAVPVSCVGKNCNPALVEMEVKDVIPLKDADTHAVVLVSKENGTILPIFCDESSAVAIAFRLAHRTSPHPLAHDLLDKLVTELGGKVDEVRIDGIEGQVYSGHLLITQGQKHLELEARPSDSIAMALTRGAKIYASRQVLASAGITREEISRLRHKMESMPPDLPDMDEGDSGPGVGGSGPALPDGKKDNEIRL